MRHPLTPAEQKVWERVRNNQLGFKIRRQHPIDHFIADFYCARAKLCIEIDVDTHAEPGQAEMTRPEPYGSKREAIVWYDFTTTTCITT